jgi:tetratricopeptide (TPR) repeat protein
MRVFSNGACVDARRRGWCRLGIVALAIAGLALVATPGLAQDQEELGDVKTREASSMSEEVYKELANAQEKIKENDYAEALKRLDKLRDNDELNSYERAQVWNLYAFIYHAQDNYPKAIDVFKRILDEEGIDQALEAGTLYSLAVLSYATEEWRQVISMINRWIALTSESKPQAHELLAEAHFQLEEYREVIPQIRKVIELRRASGEEVAERSYLLMRAAYLELEDFVQVAAILEELISLYPKNTYWMQLAGTYGEAGQEKKQLNVLELAYYQGYLDSEQELLLLAGLLLRNDLPLRAGKVLQKGLDEGVLEPTLENWRLLSQAWTLAYENRKAIPALIQATKLSEDGELDIVLGQTYFNVEEWESAAQSLRAGIRKGGLRRQDLAYVMLGQVLFTLEAYQDSREAFEKAQRDSRSRQLAAQWLVYIDNELDRKSKLQEALEE